MMKLHLDDPNLTATLDWVKGDRMKLVVTYPCDGNYSRMVAQAMDRLLKPSEKTKAAYEKQQAKEQEQTKKQEGIDYDTVAAP